jgi:hypothetical protein
MNDKSKVQCIVEGLQIILEYGGLAQVSTGHDELYAGSDNLSMMESMTPEDRERMIGLSWMWNERYECWHIFI